jgi:membrane protease subunit HflK
MMRRMQDRFRQRRGGSGGGGGGGQTLQIGPRGFAVMAGLLGLGWLATGIYVVPEGQVAVVTTFGRFDGQISTPGLHARLPTPIQSHRIVSLAGERRISIGGTDTDEAGGDNQMITGDENLVDINFAIAWQVSDPADFVFNVAGETDDEKATTVRAAAESVMREVVGQRRLQAIITTDRASVEQAVRDQTQGILDAYAAGVQITNIQLLKAEAPQEVIEAFNDVVRAQQDAESARNVAEGEKQRQIAEATGFRDQRIREARGEAERFNQVFAQYRAAPQTTRQRLYIETMERVFGRSDRVLLDTRGTGVTPIIPLDQLRRPQATAPQASAAPANPQGNR